MSLAMMLTALSVVVTLASIVAGVIIYILKKRNRRHDEAVLCWDAVMAELRQLGGGR